MVRVCTRFRYEIPYPNPTIEITPNPFYGNRTQEAYLDFIFGNSNL